MPVTLMEYASGDLSSLKGQLSPMALRVLMQDAYQGVMAMQRMGLVNTDIKPDNLLLVGGAMNESAILSGQTHLALADHDRPWRSGSTISRKNLPMTTMPYAPPEYLLYDAVVDERSALWQVSQSFYRILTGDKLYGQEELEAMAAHSGHARDRADALEIHGKMLDTVKKKLDELIRHAAHNKDTSAEENYRAIKALILNGLQLDPKDRQLWPSDVTFLARKVSPHGQRLTVPQNLLMRSPEQMPKSWWCSFKQGLGQATKALEQLLK